VRLCYRPVLCWFLDAGKKKAPQAQLTGVQKAPRHVRGHRLSSERYGDLMRAPGSMMGGMLTGFYLRVCMYGR
jgi:hypothetical protein